MTTLQQQQAANKVHERIRALLAMGSDKSSEHEAAIALKRARSLMDKHQVSAADIKNMDSGDLGVGKYGLGSSKQEVWISSLALNVARLNDCVVSYNQPINSKDHITYEFKGFNEDVELCEFMIVYLVDTCNRLYLRDKDRLRLKGGLDKTDYLLGMSDRIVSRIKEMIDQRAELAASLSDGRSLVVAKSAIVAQAHGKQKTNTNTQTREANYKAYRGGRIASNGVHLGNFVDHKAPAEDAKAIANQTDIKECYESE